MPSDFTVIVNVRHHFGNEPGSLPGAFAGTNKEFPFSCPNVDPTREAVLLFQTLGVHHDKNFIDINGTATSEPSVYGGIPVSESERDWNGNVMLVRSNVLRQDNVLRVGARDSRGSILGNLDDFVIDNVVIFFKTR
jgi:hypothetical protein